MNAPAYFRPYDPSFAADPYAVYARLREENPSFRCRELGMTLFTRYEDIRGILIDGRFGRTLDHVSSAGEIARRRRETDWDSLPSYSRYVRTNLLETEGSDHSRVRRLVSAALPRASSRPCSARLRMPDAHSRVRISSADWSR